MCSSDLLVAAQAAAPPAAQAATPRAAQAAAQPVAAPPVIAAPVPTPATPAAKSKAAAPAATGITPNAERVVTIGAIDKRTGVTRTFAGKPGQMFNFGTLNVTVRTCETTPPWEQKLTGAFLLINETNGRAPTRRIYSGWMFGESPSLHPLEHARYDIWVKSCTMRFPETGPDTVLAGSVGSGVGDTPKASKAKKSAEIPSAEAN